MHYLFIINKGKWQIEIEVNFFDLREYFKNLQQVSYNCVSFQTMWFCVKEHETLQSEIVSDFTGWLWLKLNVPKWKQVLLQHALKANQKLLERTQFMLTKFLWGAWEWHYLKYEIEELYRKIKIFPKRWKSLTLVVGKTQ